LAEAPARNVALATADARKAAACLAVDPAGLGGVVLRTDLGDASERWLELLRALLPDGETLRRLPLHIDDDRLLGGTDLAATLRSGRAVFARGLLEESATGVLVLSMAERTPPQLAARLGSALDRHAVNVARDGVQREFATRFAVVALDNGRGTDERCAPRLLERLAMHLDLDGLTLAERELPDAAAVLAARNRLAGVSVDDESLRALCATASACGVDSLRAPTLALRLARASAALAARGEVGAEDLQFAARLVIAPRATQIPAPPSEQPPAPPPPPPPEPQQAEGEDTGQQPDESEQPPPPETPPKEQEVGTMEDQVLESASAAIPAGLLEQLAASEAARRRSSSSGRSGASMMARRRGRPVGVRSGSPRNGTRLNIVATLRTAAPWQALRRAQAQPGAPRVQVRVSDFRVTWYRQKTETVTVFAIDASGSSALHRLAEAKGAVELLLADCYVRRDQVAVLAFRGKVADVALTPTRSLVRVKRSLASMPGGGGTPLAAGLEAACRIAEQVMRHGQTPSLVLLTDGHANVARDGSTGRARGEEDALLAARGVRALGLRTLLVDTAPRPQPLARKLADTMLARYLPLPYADARALAAAVQNAG
jgi:magnesium chelatase subunit D